MYVFEMRRCSSPGINGSRFKNQLSGLSVSVRPHTVLNWP